MSASEGERRWRPLAITPRQRSVGDPGSAMRTATRGVISSITAAWQSICGLVGSVEGPAGTPSTGGLAADMGGDPLA